MIFSSIDFIFHFLPVFLAVYFAVPYRWKNWILLGGSLAFYIWGAWKHPLYLLLLILASAVAYLLGRKMAKCKSAGGKKHCLLAGLAYSLGLLAFFKYQHSLPLGISFYTFQVCSYLIDVYRGTIPAERSLPRLSTWVCMFPQLLSGPLTRYGDISKRLKNRTHSMDGLEEGFRFFTVGLGMKVLIANQVGNLWKQTFAIGFESISTPMAWLGLLAYSLQIYFDFYG